MNLKIPCPNKDEYGVHPPKYCYLCNTTGYTVIPASFTDEPVTEVRMVKYNSLGDPEFIYFKDGFGRITRSEGIKNETV